MALLAIWQRLPRAPHERLARAHVRIDDVEGMTGGVAYLNGTGSRLPISGKRPRRRGPRLGLPLVIRKTASFVQGANEATLQHTHESLPKRCALLRRPRKVSLQPEEA